MLKQSQRIAVYGVITAEGKILLSLLNQGPNRGKWNLIGGGIKHGEEPVEALRREMMEEAGIPLDQEPTLWRTLSDRRSFKFPDGREEDLHTVRIIYRIPLESTSIPFKSGPDGDSSDGCKWFGQAEMDEAQLVPYVVRVLEGMK